MSIVHRRFEKLGSIIRSSFAVRSENRLQLAAAKNSPFQPLVEVAEMIARALDCLAFLFRSARPLAPYFRFLKIGRDVICN